MTPGVIRELSVFGALAACSIACFVFAHKLRRADR